MEDGTRKERKKEKKKEQRKRDILEDIRKEKKTIVLAEEVEHQEIRRSGKQD